MLAFWKEDLAKLDSVLKSKDITLLMRVHIGKAIVFPVVMYGCENWTVNKAESRRIDAFELWYWRKLLRVPRTARRSNQSILKEISPGYLLEGLMLKLKLQYFGYLMLGKTEGRGQQRITSMIQWTWANSGDGEGQRGLLCCRPWGCKKLDMT